ncbi:insect pheromone-binding family, a10/OS-D domain-containing protein [Phthorimaea operculella]|nr:insect pheromone-binding family, a10/OS-D domain-containing protein [Phthorimaea operculella]
MKLFLLITSLIYLLRGIEGKDEKYTTKYDGVNLEEILANERLLTGYVNCLLDQGPCTPDGNELKRNLPDAIDNDCAKCTERQKAGADEVMGYIIDHRPNDWAKLEKKYLSDGSYKQKYLDSKKRGNSSATQKGESSKESGGDKIQSSKEKNNEDEE